MKSITIHPMLKIFAIEPPRGAREAYRVISKKLDGSNQTCYDVIVWDDVYYWEAKHKQVNVLRLTCECLGSQYSRPCRHMTAVLKRRMPTATFWHTEPDAVRQHRRRYPIKFAPNTVTTSSFAKGGVIWASERHAYKRVRRPI